MKEWEKFSRIFNKPLGNNLWGGCPNIVFEVRSEGRKLEKVIIGEVKYIFLASTARSGLKGLMDYCQLVRYRNESGNYNFVSSEDNVEVVGLLLMGRLRDDQQDAEQSEPLQGLKIKKDATGE